MKSTKVILLAFIFTLISCKEQKLEAQKTVVLAQGTVEKITVTDFKSKIEFNTVQLIDVRTPEEYREGHISNAKNINFYDTDFLAQLAELDKNKPVYLYCKSGGRSSKASARLHDAGFSAVYDLKGGFVAWQKAGLPVKE